MVGLKAFAASMSPPRSFTLLTVRSCRTPLSAPRILAFGLRTPSIAALPTIVRLRRYTSTMLPLPADRTHHDIQKATPTTAEIVGQSGRRYLIERVLQDKEILSGRVFLATYVLLEPDCRY